MDKTPEQIAALLDDDCRQWILSDERNDGDDIVIVSHSEPEWDKCAGLGLAEYWIDRLTERGWAVRAAILQQDNTNG